MLNSHLTLFLKSLLLYVVFCSTQIAYADFKLPAIDEKFIELKAINPTRDAGYVVGDELTRNITLTIKKPYQLVQESLPILGYEHRYKGQISGIELTKINHDETDHGDHVIHQIDLTYQVFTTGKLAKPAILRAEFLKIRNLNTKNVVQYRIPSFGFRISPLSVFGSVKLDKEMSPFIKPLHISSDQAWQRLYIALGVLALALIGLLYILGMRAWLPRMGAPFAKAYRDIKKCPHNAEGVQQAVSRLHTALNKTAGGTVFSDNLNTFIEKKPNFSPAKAELEQFFDLSRFTFFEENATQPLATQSKDWLLTLCRHLRDCERGLTPDINTQSKQG